jgi:hypothetical protein
MAILGQMTIGSQTLPRFSTVNEPNHIWCKGPKVTSFCSNFPQGELFVGKISMASTLPTSFASVIHELRFTCS